MVDRRAEDLGDALLRRAGVLAPLAGVAELAARGRPEGGEGRGNGTTHGYFKFRQLSLGLGTSEQSLCFPDGRGGDCRVGGQEGAKQDTEGKHGGVDALFGVTGLV